MGKGEEEKEVKGKKEKREEKRESLAQDYWTRLWFSFGYGLASAVVSFGYGLASAINYPQISICIKIIGDYQFSALTSK